MKVLKLVIFLVLIIVTISSDNALGI